MIKDKSPMPKIRHNPVDKRESEKLKRVITHFFKEVVTKKALEKQREGWTGWDDPDNILKLRKRLVSHIKKGMLERKDQEEDIALLATFIWFNRLEGDRKRAIAEEWG
jgi:hypothetical protein